MLDKIGEWVELAAESGRDGRARSRSRWLVAAGLYGVAGGGRLLLVWVTIKPLVRPSPAWTPAPSVELDWVERSGPGRLATIGVALEHDPADAEILNRALSLAQPGQTAAGPAPRRRHADDPGLRRRDRRPRDRGRRALPGRGRPRPRGAWATRPARSCSTAPTAPAQLVGQLRREPVDLLVVGSHGHGLVRDLLSARPWTRSATASSIPMLIARPDRGRPPTRPPRRTRRSPTPALDEPAPDPPRLESVGPDRVGAGGLIDRGPARVLECDAACETPGTESGRVRAVNDAMAITYYKRFRMEIDLDGSLPPPRAAAPVLLGAPGRSRSSTSTPRSST